MGTKIHLKTWQQSWGGLVLPLCFFLFAQSALAEKAVNPSQWLLAKQSFALEKLLENFSPADTDPGVVVAGQSRVSPDYYFHWVRDAGIVVDSVLTVYEDSSDPTLKARLADRLNAYANFSRKIQETPSLTDLGEPKYHVNGLAYDGPWGRPQNDGPALRAISLIRWAKILLHEGKPTLVTPNLYAAELPAQSVIKRDLEYVAHHWREPSFDLWEEVKGRHFYTLMVQRRALLDGAQLATTLSDPGAARFYSQEAAKIEAELSRFWDSHRGYIVSTVDKVEGLDYKFSNLDSAVVLGLIHGQRNDGFLPWTDWRVQATVQRLVDVFAVLYPINQRGDLPGVAIGRYPEDRYGGADFNGGNPWPLCSLAIAEGVYRWDMDEGLAEQMVARVIAHAHADGSLNEQIDRHSGYMTSVPDLTWNYAALLSTGQALLRRTAVRR